jgi:hypothetical protein
VRHGLICLKNPFGAQRMKNIGTQNLTRKEQESSKGINQESHMWNSTNMTNAYYKLKLRQMCL